MIRLCSARGNCISSPLLRRTREASTDESAGRRCPNGRRALDGMDGYVAVRMFVAEVGMTAVSLTLHSNVQFASKTVLGNRSPVFVRSDRSSAPVVTLTAPLGQLPTAAEPQGQV